MYFVVRNGFNIPSGTGIAFASTNQFPYSPKDVGLIRYTSGILQINDGSGVHAFRDLKCRTIYNDTIVTSSVSASGLLAVSGIANLYNLTSFYNGVRIKRTTVNNADYSAQTSDHIIAYVGLNSPKKVTLPSAAGASGQIFIIKDEIGSGALSNIMVSGQTGELIDGQNTYSIDSAYESVSLYSNNSHWFIF